MDDRFDNVLLFKGLTQTEIETCLRELHGIEKAYIKGERILHAGDVTDSMGIVLSGSITIESNDTWGNCTILSNVGKNGFFAETYALLHPIPMLVDVTANKDCRILFLQISNLKRPPYSSELWTQKLLANLLTISAKKNLTLSSRSFHTAPKTIRGRVMAYLNSLSLQTGSQEFDIPFDRQQLADYLNIDRTALSKELGKMKREKIINFRKNHFILKEQ